MSSDHRTELERARTLVPAVPDEVEQARAELQAALWAIEQKANVPKRVGRAAGRGVAHYRSFGQQAPAAALGAAAVVAAAVGTGVWALATLITKRS